MIFKGENGQTVEFRILRKTGEEWLGIYTEVKSKIGHWQTVDECLMVGEVEMIIDWLRTLAGIKNPEDTMPEWVCAFIEPNLDFTLVKKNPKTIRISFWAETRPIAADDFTQYYVDCPLSDEELSTAADELENDLNKIRTTVS